jgi:hypothetical protein
MNMLELFIVLAGACAPLLIVIAAMGIASERRERRISVLERVLIDVASKACSESALEEEQYELIEQAMPGTAHIFDRFRRRVSSLDARYR